MASPADQTIVKYIILETDDYKEPEHPNFFRSSKPAHQMKLHDIKERFIDWKVSRSTMESLKSAGIFSFLFQNQDQTFQR